MAKDRGQHNEQACKQVDGEMTRFFELFGKRWTGLIVAVLTEQAAYFADLRRAIRGSVSGCCRTGSPSSPRRVWWCGRSTPDRRCGWPIG
ncbi:hypothetical protein GCM10017744_052510 [Streptomyces antimycoticus]